MKVIQPDRQPMVDMGRSPEWRVLGGKIRKMPFDSDWWEISKVVNYRFSAAKIIAAR